jgi:hypothetical protein
MAIVDGASRGCSPNERKEIVMEPRNAARMLTTSELAEILRIKPQSIRAALCVGGSYFGIRPQKLPNGRLLWPKDSPEHIIAMGVRK